jgi:hypothetical protein
MHHPFDRIATSIAHKLHPGVSSSEIAERDAVLSELALFAARNKAMQHRTSFGPA